MVVQLGRRNHMHRVRTYVTAPKSLLGCCDAVAGHAVAPGGLALGLGAPAEGSGGLTCPACTVVNWSGKDSYITLHYKTEALYTACCMAISLGKLLFKGPALIGT